MGGEMKAGAVICLAVGILCSPLAAQQAVIASAAAPSLPAILTMPPAPELSRASRAAGPADLELASLAVGFPANNALYAATLLHGPANVCTQALPPMLAAPQSDYAFDHLQFTAAAFKSAFTHDNMVKMARNFVPGQPFPDAPSYVPLTSHQKFELFLRRAHSFDTVSGAFIDSITAQVTGAYPSFGGGMAGYGKRLAAATAGAESASFFGTFALPALLHQDPRYFRSQQPGISDRLAYAASRVLIGRSDSGRSVINTSLILSEFVQAAVSNAYIPYRRETVPGTIENALTGLGSVAQARILNEFWPDIMRFVAQHEPGTIHHWHEKWNNSSLGQYASR
jgi:hypothetical protein